MRLDVIDFGGSLGSTYRQCRPLLDAVQHLQWHVVAQPHFVEAGRQEVETDELHFWNDISDVPEKTGKIGRASCRERVSWDVVTSVVAVPIKQNSSNNREQ